VLKETHVNDMTTLYISFGQVRLWEDYKCQIFKRSVRYIGEDI